MVSIAWQFDIALHQRTIYGIIIDPETKAQVVRMLRAPGEATRLLTAAIDRMGHPKGGLQLGNSVIVYEAELEHACRARGVRVVHVPPCTPQAASIAERALATYLASRGAA